MKRFLVLALIGLMTMPTIKANAYTTYGYQYHDEIELTDGNVFGYDGNKGFVKVKLDSNGTATKKDDVVLKVKRVKTRIYKTERLTRKVLIHRKGKATLVEEVDGIVLNSKGDGRDKCGYYISYKGLNVHKGDKVKTFLIYEDNNYVDDIVYRFDFLK